MPVYVASQRVMDAVAGFPIHRGVLAIGAAARSAETPDGAACRLARARARRGAGRHLQPRQYGRDLPQRRRLRRRRRAARRHLLRPALPQGDPGFGRRGAESSVRRCRRCRPRWPICWPRTASANSRCRRRGALDIRDAGRPERMALYLGTEGEGLPASLLSRLTTVRIPIAPGFDSLNVAAASAIALHDCTNSSEARLLACERTALPRRRRLLQGPHAVGEAGDLLVRPRRRCRLAVRRRAPC